MLKSYFKKFFYSCLESMPLWSVIFLLNPTLISIKSNKHLDYHDSILIFGISFILISLTTGLFISIFPKKYYKIPISFIRSLFVVTFLISIFYPAAGSLQDGTAKTLPSLKYFILLYSAYVIGLVFLIIMFLRKIKLFRNFYIALSIVCLGTISYYYITFTSTFSPKTLGKPHHLADLSFGSDRNIIFIIADMLQGSMLEQFFHMNPDEKKYFDGFTFYSRATTPFPFTGYSLPSILTGNLYANDLPNSSQEEAKNASLASSLLTDATSKGFDSVAIGLPCKTTQLSNNHFYYKDIPNINIVVNLFDLSIQRIIKFSLSKFIPKKFLPRVYNKIYQWKIDSCNVMRRLASEKIGDKKEKILVFHTLVPHNPVIFTKQDLHKDLYFTKTKVPNPDNIFEELIFFVGEVKKLLVRMKSIGVYDKSLIIITADHGYRFAHSRGYYKFTTEKKKMLSDYPGAEDFNSSEKIFSRPIGQYNPAILIKPPFINTFLQVNRKPSTTLNLRRVVKKYLQGRKNKLDLLKEFEDIGKHKIVLFKDHNKKEKVNICTYADNHIIVEFKGNISNFLSIFKKKILKRYLSSYIIGEKIETVSNNHLMDGNWLSDRKGGSWLIKDPGIVYIKNSNIKKNKSYKLRVDVSGYIVKDIHPVQKVNLVLNGIKFGEIMLTKPGKHNLEINIPSELMSNSKVNVVEFQPLNAIAPVKLGVSQNTIPYSICLYSFQIIENG